MKSKQDFIDDKKHYLSQHGIADYLRNVVTVKDCKLIMEAYSRQQNKELVRQNKEIITLLSKWHEAHRWNKYQAGMLLDTENLLRQSDTKQTPNNEYKGNWTEDYKDGENQYINKCVDCEALFFGDKHRCVCKLCHDARISKLVNH